MNIVYINKDKIEFIIFMYNIILVYIKIEVTLYLYETLLPLFQYNSLIFISHN